MTGSPLGSPFTVARRAPLTVVRGAAGLAQAQPFTIARASYRTPASNRINAVTANLAQGDFHPPFDWKPAAGRSLEARRPLHERRRSGIILAAVLAALLVAMLLGAALAQSIVTRQRAARRAEQQLQSFWLVESALQRAAGKLAASRDYQGETWRVPADVFGDNGSGEAVIRIDPASPPQTGWRIRVESQYPEDALYRILYQRELTVAFPESKG